MSDDLTLNELAHSFYGCNVGNVHAPVWTCGLEWGGGYDSDVPIALAGICPYDLSDCQTWKGGEPKTKDHDEHAGDFEQNFWAVRSSFCRNVVKLLTVLHASNPTEAKWSDVSWRDLMNSIADDGFVMTMNAFPISFAGRGVADDEWRKLKVRFNNGKVVPLTEWSGQEYFYTYREEVIKQRRELYRTAMSEFKPKLILAFSKQSDELRRLFDDCEEPAVDWGQWGTAFQSLGKGNNDCFVKTVSYGAGQALLAVLPFPSGAYGLTSDEKICRVGEELAKLCDEKFGKDWRVPNYPSGCDTPYCNKESKTLRLLEETYDRLGYWRSYVENLNRTLTDAEKLKEDTEVLLALYRHATAQLQEINRKISEFNRRLYRETFGQEYPAL